MQSSTQAHTAPLAFGRRSVIYQHGPQTVLKLYEKCFPQHEVAGEFEKTRLIAKHTTIPIAKAIELFKSNGQLGITFEKVAGIAITDMMMQRIWQVPRYVRKLAEIHRQIHQNRVPLISQEEFLLPFLETSDRLSGEELLQVKAAFSRLHTNIPKLCHGDFHQGNVLLTKDGFFVLDWMDAFSGNPLLDVALTAVNAATSSTPPHIPKVFSFLYETVSKIVRLDRWILYEYGVSEKQHQVRDALLVAAAIQVARCKEDSWEKQRKYLKRMLTKV